MLMMERCAVSDRWAKSQVIWWRFDHCHRRHFGHPYFIDCRAVPWVVNPDLPDIGLKVLRVSQETGFISLMVRHNGVAAPSQSYWRFDFLVLEGALVFAPARQKVTGPAHGSMSPRCASRCYPARDG